MKTRTRFIAVNGESDRTFSKYSDACAWLDRISPATATAGFTTEDGGTDDDTGERTVFVRHV